MAKIMDSSEQTYIQPVSDSIQKTGIRKGRMAMFVIFFVLLMDQFLKIWIKTHMTLGDQIPVIENFFYIHFTENYGMAFGLELEGVYGKLLLSLFRILAVGGIAWYLISIVKQKAHSGLIFCLSLIMAGALGNILDSAFYGLIFSESTPMDSAIFLPEEGGYAGFLHGAVVDMFYFNSHFDSTFWSSEPYTFSFPIFNISDSAITIGVIVILIFKRRFFKHEKKEVQVTDTPGFTDNPDEGEGNTSVNQ